MSISKPLVVSFGGGVNSAAMLVGMRERGIKPDLILFADTGGEKPETYRFIDKMNGWLRPVGRETQAFPQIITVKNEGKHATLEQSCLTNKTLPSLAYGFKGCSIKFKVQVQEKYEKTIFGKEQVIRKAIGYDVAEGHRSDLSESGRYRYWYPLREWGWDRDDCIRAIKQAGLPVPVKSACYFCPASKKHEVLALKLDHPDLFQRAVQMERNAAGYNQAVAGLGRSWSWEQLAKADESQFKMFTEVIETPCMCFDGEEASV